MTRIADLLFEVRMLKDLNRSGYSFLGTGKESIAEHSFTTAFLCFVMARLEPDVNAEKLISMALVHDTAEARTGDLNYVHKHYNTVDESKAVLHLIQGLDWAKDIAELIDEFNQAETMEARLANDADQLSFILELKKLKDLGATSPESWLSFVVGRLKTDTGKQLAREILCTRWDEWWTRGYSE
ncbi:MAG: metal-dependent phosphohydrolase [Desulfobacter postgatei]|uniref:5'-deoxynucleotidase n=1 Tax=Desulfobacter postgatei TaxID=2293 RepID=A0A2G6MUI9_9BACT|nr:MAG: metal-dependent phosphohydrolase [Desulfobacter postgatei]